MRPRYLVAVVAAVVLAFLAAPAQAAMPTSKPTFTKVCPNNPNKKLKIWVTKKVFAADNPCRDWLVITHKGAESSDSTTQGVNLAGYSKLNLPNDYLSKHVWNWGLSPTAPFCDQPESGTIAYYGDGHELKLSGSGLGCDYDF
jgi:hypothetical protein